MTSNNHSGTTGEPLFITAELEQLLEQRSTVDYLERMHSTCMVNMATMHTGNEDSMIKVANFIKHIVTGFSAPALFVDDNARKVEQYITDDVDHLGYSLVYAMQVFKHGRKPMIKAIAAMINESWNLNYSAAPPTADECEKFISNFPAMTIVFMCMLFPNTSIGMIGQLFTPPTQMSNG